MGMRIYMQRPYPEVLWYPLKLGAASSRRMLVMSHYEQNDNAVYKVVINHEEQYSIWPADRDNALGWRDAGKAGTKAECLAYIEQIWTDMRPLSLRNHMEKRDQGRPMLNGDASTTGQ
jgi:MbtH protein